jgi:glutamyl-Q tRNA(Asp) synthetase
MARAVAGLPALAWREADPLGGETAAKVQADPPAWGDVILARREIPASYHLAVVVDDAFQRVTHVVRGKDLQSATAVHRVLQTLLGLPEPVYFHHRLIVDATGAKLSKSRGSQSIRAWRAAGDTPESLVESLAEQEHSAPASEAKRAEDGTPQHGG